MRFKFKTRKRNVIGHENQIQNQKKNVIGHEIQIQNQKKNVIGHEIQIQKPATGYDYTTEKCSTENVQ